MATDLYRVILHRGGSVLEVSTQRIAASSARNPFEQDGRRNRLAHAASGAGVYDAELARRVVAHLLYRRGTSIPVPEPLAVLQGGRLSGTETIRPNPADNGRFNGYYIGRATNFYRRAREHGWRFQRMYVVYMQGLVETAAVRVESQLIQRFSSAPTPMSGGALQNLNQQESDPPDNDAVYLAFQ